MATDNSQQARAWMHRRFGAALAGKATDAFCVRAAAIERAAPTAGLEAFPDVAAAPRGGTVTDAVIEFDAYGTASDTAKGVEPTGWPRSFDDDRSGMTTPAWRTLTRQLVVRAQRDAFYVTAGPVFAEIERSERLLAESSGGRRADRSPSPTQVCWLNRTVKAPAWPGVLAEIAADDAVSSVDLPRRIVRDSIVVGGVTGAPAFRSRTGSIGADVVAAIIDSEIDASHPALAGRVVRRRNFTEEPWGYPDMHGTAVAGIVGASSPEITGVAPGVMIYLYKVLATNAYLTGTDFDGARALQLAVEDGADVANISWGVGPAGEGRSREARAVDAAWALGMTVVKSAGNRGPFSSTLTSPADASGVIVVGATDVDGTGVQAYSSRGPLPNGEFRPHLVAPGGSGRNGVVSCRVGGSIGPIPPGTSFAAPHVTGLVALLMGDDHELTPDEVRDLLIANCRDLGQPAVVQGAGLASLDGVVTRRETADLGMARI